MQLVVEKTRLNMWNVGGLVIVLATQLVGGAIAWNNLTHDLKEVRDTQAIQDEATRARFATIEKQVEPVPSLIFDQKQQDKELDELKVRVANMFDKFSDKLDSINDSVNSVRTEIRVLAQEVRNTTEKPNHSAFFH